MSYNGSGTFQINTSGQPVVAGTVISSTAFNALTADLATGLSTAITKDGQTTTTARIPFAAGINSSLTTDSTSTSTGSIITSGGVGVAKALYVGTTLNVTGVATFSATPIYSSLTASSAVATDASKNLVSVTNTGTGNNVLATSPTLVTPILGTPQSGSLVNCTDTNYTGFKNRIINGALSIWQRGTSITPALNSLTSYVSDRWASYQTGAALAVSRASGLTSGSNVFQYAASVTGGVGNTEVTFLQCIESLNTADLSGQSITFSGWLYSTTAKSITLYIDSADVADVFSATTNRASVVFSHTGSGWEKATLTYASANVAVANGIRVRFSFGALTSGTVGFTGVQLEKGSVATSFDYRPYGTELQLAQRYFQKFSAILLGGYAGASTTYYTTYLFPVELRAIPTILYSNFINSNSGNAGTNSVGTKVWRVGAIMTLLGNGYSIFDAETSGTEL